MTTLLTGFNPFGPHTFNTSQYVVERLSQKGIPGLIGAVLPTEFVAAGNQIVALIREHRPDAVICLGLAQGAEAIRLERVALNLDDATLPDNAGFTPKGEEIIPGAPLAYASTLPIEAMRDGLMEHGIPVVISNHAGAFVCNHVFYRARHEMETSGLRSPCGFIHLPGTSQDPQRRFPVGTTMETVAWCLEYV